MMSTMNESHKKLFLRINNDPDFDFSEHVAFLISLADCKEFRLSLPCVRVSVPDYYCFVALAACYLHIFGELTEYDRDSILEVFDYDKS